VTKLLWRKVVLVSLAIVMIAGLFLIDSNAQRRSRHTRRRSPAPRITNPAIYQPTPNDNSNTSAETSGSESLNANQNPEAAQTSGESPEEMRKTIRTLSTQVDKLNEKLGQMEQSQRSLLDLERLSRAEQRATSLRAQLREVQQKKSDAEARLEEIDYALKPENIERATAGYGSTRPEEVRAQRKRQLESERGRVSKDLDQLTASETQLNEAIAASDVEVERLRKRLEEAEKVQMENAKSKDRTAEESGAATPSPSPTPQLR
jgi:DNA repair exonuclease SbcCD ATPase subunit